MTESHEDEHCDVCADIGVCSCPPCVEADHLGYWAALDQYFIDDLSEGAIDEAE